MALNGHFLQSAAWARVQLRLRNPVTVGADRDWCWLGVVRRAGPIRYLYLPMGPSLRGEAALGAAIVAAHRRAQRLGCAFLRFEPGPVSSAIVAATGARQVRPRQYQHTLILQLDRDDESLWRGVNSGHRSRINGAAKRGLRIERSDDPALMPSFVSLLRQTEHRKRFFSFEDAYFAAIADELLPTGAASLYFAVAGGTRVAAALVFDFGTTRYYAFGATSDVARKLMPAPPLVWRCITDARTEGRQRFDFWGSAPPGAGGDHPWAGITEFKRGFGGEPLTSAGTWEIPVRPVSAALFTLAQRLRH
jgi:lipid II:glycine glycyltransferase (peptidoglycan interpeptide bridge formation enzyme)